MSRLSNEVLTLAKGLAPFCEDDIQDLMQMVNYENACAEREYEGTITIGQVVGRFQVYRHLLIDACTHYTRVVKGEEMPEWTNNVNEDIEGYIDWQGTEEDDDGNEVEYGYIFYEEYHINCEFAQHWLDTETNKVIMIGKPYRENGEIYKTDYTIHNLFNPLFYVGEDDQPWEYTSTRSRQELVRGWAKYYDNFYGDFCHYDMEVHPTLLARGIEPLDCTYSHHITYEGMGKWYCDRPYHERVKYPYWGCREFGEEDEEKWVKMGGLKMISSMLDTDRHYVNKDNLFNAWKIRLRNNYNPSNEWMWNENIHYLDNLKMDCHNPKYVCPKDLDALHSSLSAKWYKKMHKENQEERIRKEKRQEEEEKLDYKLNGKEYESKYAETHGKYLKIGFEYKGISFSLLQDVKEYLDEGLHMHNCVFHSKFYEKTDTIVLKAQIDGKTLELVQLDLMSGKVVQSHGKRNQDSVLNKDIIEGAESNAELYQEVFWQTAI